MSAVNWLNGEAFTVLGQHIKWSDMIGNVIGLIGLAFGWRRSLWSWPVQFLSGLVLFAAFATAVYDHGAASFSRSFARYEPMPENVAQKLIASDAG